MLLINYLNKSFPLAEWVEWLYDDKITYEARLKSNRQRVFVFTIEGTKRTINHAEKPALRAYIMNLAYRRWQKEGKK